jgi:peptidoglycan hydrolase-like protein with peptidoglycan-binding domain
MSVTSVGGSVRVAVGDVVEDAVATGYRDLMSDVRMSAPGSGSTDYGSKLTGLQNDLVNAGYYPSNDYSTEVDGKYGARTKAAVTQLQQDLKAAGLYSGSANGIADAALTKALAQLKSGVPSSVTGAVADRLARFAKSETLPASVMSQQQVANSSFDHARKAPVALDARASAPNTAAPQSADLGEQRIAATKQLLGDLFKQVSHGANLSPQQAAAAKAMIADALINEPNTNQLLAKYGKGQLGFDPAKSSDAEIDTFLKMVSAELKDESRAAAPTAAVPGQAVSAPRGGTQTQVTAAMGTNLYQAMGRKVNLMDVAARGQVNVELGKMLGQLKNDPNRREILATRFTPEELSGINPRTASDETLNALLDAGQRAANNTVTSGPSGLQQPGIIKTN